MRIGTLCVLAALYTSAMALVLTQSKNMSILNDTYYITRVNITRINAQYTPSKVSLDYSINNTIPSANQYFDLFYYLDTADRQCYESVIGNQSFLRACSFIQNNYTILRNTGFSSPLLNERNLENVTSAQFFVVVDNTQYPYPNGSYDANNISLQETTTISITLSDTSETIGVRLIFINCTVLLIYGVVIAVLYYKHRKNLKAIKEFEQVKEEDENIESSQDEEEIEVNKSLKHSQKESLVEKLQP